jgi:hypothetical protein
MKLSIIISLWLLLGCAANATELEKSDVTDTTAIRISNTQCIPTLMVKLELAEMGEKLVASALMKVTPDDVVIVTFFSNDSGEWSVMLDGKNGISCMVMWGDNWRMAK